MKRDKGVFALLAVILPVALGLALIYLYVMGGLDVSAVAICLIAMVMLIPLVGVLVDAAANESYRAREIRFRRSMHRHKAAAPIDDPASRVAR